MDDRRMSDPQHLDLVLHPTRLRDGQPWSQQNVPGRSITSGVRRSLSLMVERDASVAPRLARSGPLDERTTCGRVWRAMRLLVPASLVVIAITIVATGTADAAKRRCATIRYDGFEARDIRSKGLPAYLMCASVRHVPEAWIRQTGAALPGAGRAVEFTALFRDWSCGPTTGYYAAERGAAAVDIECIVWRYHRDGSATAKRGVWVRWQAWNL